MTQGRGDGESWVTAFMLSYSLDAHNWQYVDDHYGNQRVSLLGYPQCSARWRSSGSSSSAVFFCIRRLTCNAAGCPILSVVRKILYFLIRVQSSPAFDVI